MSLRQQIQHVQQIQPRLTPRAFSVELLHTDSAEDTGLELGIVIIKKEHPSLLFQKRKEQSPILVTEFGIVIDFKLSHT